jgi:hypothetical protein
MKLHIVALFFGLVSFTHAAPSQISSPEIIILTSDLGKEGDNFPSELIKFWEVLPINKDGNTIDVVPNIKMIRIDLSDEKEFPFPKFESFIDKLIKPDPRITLRKTHDFLEKSKISKDFSTDQVSQKELVLERKAKFLADIPTAMEFLKSEKLEKDQFSNISDLIEELKKQISKNSQTSSKYLIFYKLSNLKKAEVVLNRNDKDKLQLDNKKNVSVVDSESQQHLNQGMIYVSMAKANLKTKSENIKNAISEFDAAVKKEEESGHCFALAIMNRGVAYWIDKKLNLAEKDLIKASECDDSGDPIIFYNLTAYYSAINKSDLSLEPLSKTLDLGFKDCDILRKDADLKNLRKTEDFRKILEQHKLFC